MGSRKMLLVNQSAGQQWRCRRREQTCGHGWKEKGGRIERAPGNTDITMQKIRQPVEMCYMIQTAQAWCPVTTWRTGKWEGGDMCTPTADSCWCTAETNTTLEGNYPPTEIN